MSPDERRALTDAAHTAWRGQHMTLAAKIEHAKSVEQKQAPTTPTERRLAEILKGRLEVTPLKAVGPYNVDLAAGPIAVEIFSGHWHSYGRAAARAPKRYSYLLDQGWPFVIVWVTNYAPLSASAADYIVAFAERSSSDPTLSREYRVIWGDGQETEPRKPKLDDIANVPSRHSRNRRRA